MSDRIEFDKVLLERLRFAAVQVISKSLLGDVKFDLGEDFMWETVMLRLEAEVLAEKLVGDTYTFTLGVPRSRWQAWKERRAPRWVRRLFPVREATVERTVHLDRYALYPEARFAVPKSLGTPVLYEWTREEKP